MPKNVHKKVEDTCPGTHCLWSSGIATCHIHERVNKLVRAMKLLSFLLICSVALIISFNIAECYTPLGMNSAIARLFQRPMRTLTRLPFHVISKLRAAKEAIASKVALTILVKSAILKKPLLVLKTLAGTRLIAKMSTSKGFASEARNEERDKSSDMKVPLQLRIAPITVKSYFHTKGTRFEHLSNRREPQPATRLSSQSINQKDRSISTTTAAAAAAA